MKGSEKTYEHEFKNYLNWIRTSTINIECETDNLNSILDIDIDGSEKKFTYVRRILKSLGDQYIWKYQLQQGININSEPEVYEYKVGNWDPVYILDKTTNSADTSTKLETIHYIVIP